MNKEMEQKEQEAKNAPVKVLGPEDMELKGTSLFCFPEKDAMRRRLAVTVGYSPIGEDAINTNFSNFIMVMIVVSSITLAIDGPTLDPCSTTKEVLNILDVLFTIIFAVECAMKIIVFGFTHTPEAYLKDVWNQLDFFIVVTSILAL